MRDLVATCVAPTEAVQRVFDPLYKMGDLGLGRDLRRSCEKREAKKMPLR